MSLSRLRIQNPSKAIVSAGARREEAFLITKAEPRDSDKPVMLRLLAVLLNTQSLNQHPIIGTGERSDGSVIGIRVAKRDRGARLSQVRAAS